MPYYKYGQYLVQQQGTEFDTLYSPNTTTPLSGVYRCEGCGISATFVKGHNIPPQNHAQHTSQQGAVRWRLVVKSHLA